ncbi:hypothetical protein Tco_1092028 [Tanacetum coccineum]|uniref:CCHC-type domain-containing protein n=1 Tax=Tanacetum coccineum TaxID=301880 RepID=A0ABQ5IA17_9ASTR
MYELNTEYNWERIRIIPPRITTRNAGRGTATPRGGRTGGRTSRGSKRTRGRTGDQGNGGIDEQGGQLGGQGNEVNDGVDGVPDFSTIIAQQLQNLLPSILAQVGNQGNNQGNNRNQNGDAMNDNIQGDVRNVIIESVQDMSGCGDDQKVKYTVGSFVDFKTLIREEFCPINEMQKLEIEFWNHAMVGDGHVVYTDRFHELARVVPHLVTPENKWIESRDRNVKDDNKRTRTGNTFATPANPVRKEYTSVAPKCVNYNLHHSPESHCHAYFNYNRLGYIAKDCRVIPRMVNQVNARTPTAAHGACFECGGTDHFKAACPRLNQA